MLGAQICEQEPRECSKFPSANASAVDVPTRGAPAAFHTTDACLASSRLADFRTGMEQIHCRVAISRVGAQARAEGIQFVWKLCDAGCISPG